MLGMLASLVGGRGGRLIGGAIGGRAGAMVGGMIGGLVGGRKLGGLLSGAKNKLAGGDDNDSAELSDKEAEILISLMVNAAKADGEIDQSEMDNILASLENATEEEQSFLKAEMTKPMTSPEDLAKMVDKEMAADAYIISLMAVKLDTEHEANYMRSLASAMGLSDDDRNQIHSQLEVEAI